MASNNPNPTRPGERSALSRPMVPYRAHPFVHTRVYRNLEGSDHSQVIEFNTTEARNEFLREQKKMTKTQDGIWA